MNYPYSKINPNSERLGTEISETTFSSRSREIWKRVHLRLITSIRIGRLMQNIRYFGPGSLNNAEDMENISELLKKQEHLSTMSQPTSELDYLPPLLFHPNQGFIVYWNIFLALTLIYTSIVTPFLLAFVSIRDFDTWFDVDLIITFIFLLDFSFTLNCAYYDKDSKLEVRRRKIFFHYLKGWLIIDLLACIPFDLILFIVNPNSSRASFNSLSKLIRLKTIPRLLRLSKVLVMFKKKKGFLEYIYYFFSLSHSGVRLLRTISMILLSLHIVSCLWYYMSSLYDFSPMTWIVRYGHLDRPIFDLYLTCVYWALTTLSTVGYGDITPATNGEIILAMAWMVVAIYFLSFAISSLSSMISQNDGGRRKQIDKKLALIDKYCAENKLPKEIKVKMQKFVKDFHETKVYNFVEKENILNEFSIELRLKIAHFSQNGAMRLFEIFEDREERFIYTVIPLMALKIVMANSIVYAVGDVSNDIYFVISGKANLISNDRLKFKIIGIGKYVGDTEVIKKFNREYALGTYENTNFWVMGPELIKIIETQFPLIFKIIEKEALKKDKIIVKELAEIRGITKAKKLGISKLSEIRGIIESELHKIIYEHDSKYKSKEDISRIEIKLDICKDLVTENKKKLENIENFIEKFNFTQEIMKEI